MKRFLQRAAVAAIAMAVGCPAFAQTYKDTGGTTVPGVVLMYNCPSGGGSCSGPVSASNPLPVSASVSASISGFSPTPAYSQLSVGASSTRVALPTGATIVVYNTGAYDAYVQLGGSGVTATSANDVVKAGGWMAFTPAGGQTYLAGIETGGATALNISGGAGLPTGTGAGGGGGGGSGGGATGSSTPSTAEYIGANSSGNLTGIVQADTSAAINISTATTTQLVALSSGKKIYVTAWDVIAGGTGNITLEYGAGSNCGTGTTVLTGAYPMTAQAGISRGGSLGPLFVVPASNALCALTSAAVQMSGSVSYTQF